MEKQLSGLDVGLGMKCSQSLLLWCPYVEESFKTQTSMIYRVVGYCSETDGDASLAATCQHTLSQIFKQEGDVCNQGGVSGLFVVEDL